MSQNIKLYDSKSFSVLEKSIAFLVLVICMSAVTFISAYRFYLIGFTAVLAIAVAFCLNKKISLSPLVVSWSFLTVWLAIGIIYSYDLKQTIVYTLFYACCIVFLFIRWSGGFYDFLLKWFFIVSLIEAVSVILSLFIKDMIPRYFIFLIADPYDASDRIRSELAENSFSGLAGEKGEAAFMLCIGIAVVISWMMVKVENKHIISLIILFAALMLTGKRMLFAIAVLILALFLLHQSKNGKVSMAVITLLVLVTGVILLYNFIPQVGNLFIRFSNVLTDSSMTGRAPLWACSIKMFQNHSAVGYGFASYNTVASNLFGIQAGFDNFTRFSAWTFNGHNVYLQILGETGIIGFVLFAVMICISVSKIFSLRIFAGSHRQYTVLYWFAVFVHIVILLDSITGNSFYTNNNLMVFVMTQSIFLYLESVKKQPEEFQLQEGRLYES